MKISLFFRYMAVCYCLVLAAATQAAQPQTSAELAKQLQLLKSEVIGLNKDLRMLEENLLFPSNTRFVVFVSARSGQYFKLDSVKLKIDGRLVTSHIYPNEERQAMLNGGIQRLYTTNMAGGKHEVTAFFTGIDQNGRAIKRAESINIEKGDNSVFLEIQIGDAPKKQAPVFKLKQW